MSYEEQFILGQAAEGADLSAGTWQAAARALQQEVEALRAEMVRMTRDHTVRLQVRDEEEARLRADLVQFMTDFPCDEGCRAYPEETCSRHGRRPRDLWERWEREYRKLRAIEKWSETASFTRHGHAVEEIRALLQGAPAPDEVDYCGLPYPCAHRGHDPARAHPVDPRDDVSPAAPF